MKKQNRNKYFKTMCTHSDIPKVLLLEKSKCVILLADIYD